ncbi:type I glyceraldehyde-3-phosphate dehydrogenase [Patescibacteria group bacterium]|nr:type I glyceraldehyde-3-phosphate dehydrogenase [Patescibacteria group bacterium]
MVKIAINGFGRIGRLTLRHILKNQPNIEVLAINDLDSADTLAHLLKYDSSYGIYDKSVEVKAGKMIVDKHSIEVFSEPDPEKLPWKKLEIDVVLECTGAFRTRELVLKHLKAGAKKVVISAPSKDADIPSFVLGVNENDYNPEKDDIVDMGSCTTNCLAPVAKVIDDNFGIVNGFMTTVHSYTNDQKILDLVHKDLRRARTAGANIIPTSTGATEAIGKIIPKLKGRMDGLAIRVPTQTVSLLDLVCNLEKEASVDEINSAFRNASKQKNFQHILTVENAPLVSMDFKGNNFSAVVDTLSTMANGKTIKVIAWYDNEWAYACRLAEFAEFVGKKL